MRMGYPVESGYVGFVPGDKGVKRILFATESEYYEYLEDRKNEESKSDIE